MTVTLTDDARLKTINAKQTGEGSEIIKQAVTLGGSVVGLRARQKASWCSFKESAKPVKITYTRQNLKFNELVHSRSEESSVMEPDAGSFGTNALIQSSSLGKYIAPTLVIHAAEVVQPVTDRAQSGGEIRLPRMVHVLIELRWGPFENKQTVGLRDVILPSENHSDRDYALHIPKSPAFGTQQFVLMLADSGAISTIQYVKNSGTTAALTGVTDVLTPFRRSTTAEQADAVKAQADLSAQQTRLAACEADPATCK
ncbi:hypothetical protein [Caballeronia sp. ATUFL_F2_KS9A]|uniref:hypothetical protein n=1 Tax=Caballeronia sp. ATUFL_F2_KS9A TaxID=2921777 RepID=UPI002028B0B8|nr:hypothetical protein [Caballeronia sp. ATUFL_F2_KS9A]